VAAVGGGAQRAHPLAPDAEQPLQLLYAQQQATLLADDVEQYVAGAQDHEGEDDDDDDVHGGTILGGAASACNYRTFRKRRVLSDTVKKIA
jgi:hypothetical protein